MNSKETSLKHSYSDDMSNKKIALLGPMPPPLGGVAVHIRRVMHKLENQNNAVQHFDTVAQRTRFMIMYLAKLKWFLLKFRPQVVFYHTPYTYYSLADFFVIVFFKLFFRYQVITVEHNCRHLYRKSVLWKKCFSFLMRFVHKQIFMGSSTITSYHKNNIFIAKNYSIEASFLPPSRNDEAAICAAYPELLHDFTQNHKPLIISNAWQLCLLDGKDLYGFDLCIDLVHDLKKDFPTIGMVFVLGQIGNDKHYKTLLYKIKKLGLQEYIFFLHDQKELWPLLKKADLFVRPTLSDGASLSIAEALYFNTPTVASDVCKRPQEVILFKTGDRGDFTLKVRSVLEGKSSFRQSLSSFSLRKFS